MKLDSKIEKLKKEAREHYLAYCDIANDYSCGVLLAEHLSPVLVYHKIEFNKTMDRLAELDPSAPTKRL